MFSIIWTSGSGLKWNRTLDITLVSISLQRHRISSCPGDTHPSALSECTLISPNLQRISSAYLNTNQRRPPPPLPGLAITPHEHTTGACRACHHPASSTTPAPSHQEGATVPFLASADQLAERRLIPRTQGSAAPVRGLRN